MSLQLKKNCTYDLLVPTSMGIRITPGHGQPVHTSTLFTMQATSAETNVASISSFLGLRVKVLTAFVKGSPIAGFIKDNLALRHMIYEGPEIEPDGPWGVRHQINIADSGYGFRGPRVYNDRAGEVGRLLTADKFDLEKIFRTEGVKIVHLSGLIGALSKETGAFILEIARTAKKYGTRVSFDLNYRASFWKNREKELRKIFIEIASLSDILVGNEEDFQLSLGLKGPETGGKNIETKMDSFKGMILEARKAFPGVSVFATTLREVLHANKHLWGALMWGDGIFHHIPPRHIPVLDRIGGGDGFVGGMLYGILKEWEPERWLQFGWASGALAVSLLTDYAQPADEEQIWSIYNGNARVKR